jgi:hypothetical protein
MMHTHSCGSMPAEAIWDFKRANKTVTVQKCTGRSIPDV